MRLEALVGVESGDVAELDGHGEDRLGERPRDEHPPAGDGEGEERQDPQRIPRHEAGASTRQAPMSRHAVTAGSRPLSRIMTRATRTPATRSALTTIHTVAHVPASPMRAMRRIEANDPPSIASEYQRVIRLIAVPSATRMIAEVIVAVAIIICGFRRARRPGGLRPVSTRAARTRRASGFSNAAMASRMPDSQGRGSTGGGATKRTTAQSARASARGSSVDPSVKRMTGEAKTATSHARCRASRSRATPRAATLRH